MDKGKLNEAARAHAAELRVPTAIPGALVPMLADMAESSYKSGVEDMMQRPLADRLTDEEAKKLREIYDAERGFIEYQTTQENASMNTTSRSWHRCLKESSRAKLRMLKSIFGKEFFTDKTNK